MPRGKQRSIRSETQQRTFSPAGSHAGRGFRYQDAAAAWLAVLGWAGDLHYGDVTPEGLDDAELTGVDGKAFVQMKSRRDRLGSYTRGEVAAYLGELWARANAASVTPSHVLLVLERGVDGVDLGSEIAAQIDGTSALGAVAAKRRFAGRWMARTRIMLVSMPRESAVNLLAERLACTPLIASVYFAAVADRIGQLSDDNGERSPGDFLSLSVSDVEHEIERLAGVLSIDDLDAALRLGLCEPVDFLTPLNDSNFYLGLDVQPGHLAAGLLSERPDARARVLNALERQRAVLIAGPSGSGKSGLMWEVARESRHTVRWFRVRSVTEGDVAGLLRLADTFRATAHMPIGFVIDDVGRNRSGLWDTLAAEAATRPNVLLLGSLREEDMFLVARRSLAIEIREQPDSDLAERIWYALKDRGQTIWPGWREPWETCKGLLLEYTHLLTQGRRLHDVLEEQVDRRVREKRRAELAVLRVTSVAGQAGATVDLARLQHVLALSDDDLAEALRRLIDEHLIQRLTSGERLGSLHQIRAAALADSTHKTPPPFKTNTAKQAIACIADEDLEGFIARTLAREPDLAEGILDGAVERIRNSGDLILLAAIARGLDIGSIGNTIERWLPHVDRLGLPRTQATMVPMFFVANTEPFLEERFRPHFEAAHLLRDMIHHDHRQTLVDRLEPQLSAILSNDLDWGAVTALLAGFLGASLPLAIETRLAEAQPDLLAMPLAEAIALLKAAGLAAPMLAKVWVERVGQAALLERLTRETPWISSVEFREEPEGLAVCANVFQVSDRLQGDLHGDVVELCRKLFALAPVADLVVASAISPDGKPAGIGDFVVATKRIPRTNLPGGALTERNRRWVAAVAQRVAPAGMSQFLADAKQLLDRLIPLLERLVDGVLRGKARVQYLDALGEIHAASKALTRPPDAETIIGEQFAIGVSDLQNILNYCSTDLLRGLINLPDRAAASYSLATDVLMQIDLVSTKEPWRLIGDEPPPSMRRLREIVEQIRMIIADAGAKGVKVSLLAPGLVKSAPPNKALRLLALSVERRMGGRLKVLNDAVETAVCKQGYQSCVTSRIVNELGGPWPYAEVLVVILLDQMIDWPAALTAIAEPVREACGEGRRLTIVPAMSALSAPEQAISGVETLFSQPFGDVAWLKALGFPPINLRLTRIFDKLASAVLEASAIEAFECAREGRASDEAVALAQALDEIETSRAELNNGLPAAERVEVIDHLNQILAMGPNLAIEFWRYMHGGAPSQAVVTLTAMKLIAIDVDVMEAAKRPENRLRDDQSLRI